MDSGGRPGCDTQMQDAPLELVGLADDVWIVNEPLSVLGMPIGHNMTVFRLASGGLLLHSPTSHTPATRAMLAELGPIEHWVAPSRTHDLYLDDWFEGCPEAATWGAPKLRKPHPEWSFTGWLADDLQAPWLDEFEIVEIRGVPRVGEWMFLHRASRTAITADVIFNLGTTSRGLGGFMLNLAGIRGTARRSRLFGKMIRDREAFEGSLRRVLEWDFERLVVGHGAPIEDDPKGRLAAAWGL